MASVYHTDFARPMSRVQLPEGIQKRALWSVVSSASCGKWVLTLMCVTPSGGSTQEWNIIYIPAVTGDIFKRKISESSASSSDITQRSPSEVSISRDPLGGFPLGALLVLGGVSTAREEGGRRGDLLDRPLMWPRPMLTFPLHRGLEECTAPGNNLLIYLTERKYPTCK